MMMIVLLGNKPYIRNESPYTPFDKFFQSRFQNKSVKWNCKSSLLGIMDHLEVCSHKKSNQIENNMEDSNMMKENEAILI